MLSLLLYLACAVFDPHQVELDRIVQMHKRMGHPAMSVHGIMLTEHGKIERRDFVFVWHSPALSVVGGDVVTRNGTKVFIITQPMGIDPPASAREGVKY